MYGVFFFFQAEDGIRDVAVTGVQTCALPISFLQMGMVGQLFVRPRQDRVPSGGSLYTYLGNQNGNSEPATNPTVDLRTACSPAADILRSEEHTSELQSRLHLVCRLLLEKKKSD